MGKERVCASVGGEITSQREFEPLMGSRFLGKSRYGSHYVSDGDTNYSARKKKAAKACPSFNVRKERTSESAGGFSEGSAGSLTDGRLALNGSHRSQSPTEPNASEELWWQRYLDRLAHEGIWEKNLKWYRIHVERLLDAFPGTKSQDLLPDAVERYCRRLITRYGGNWQTAQAIEAIRRFGKMNTTRWHDRIDWDELAVAADPDGRMDQKELEAAIEHGKFPAEPNLKAFALAMRSRRYRLRTERSYIEWVERCCKWHRLDSPTEITPALIAKFLQHLAGERMVARSTQKMATSALVLFAKLVLQYEHVSLPAFQRSAQQSRALPVVLTQGEISRIFAEITYPTHLLAFKLLYGAGLRRNECLRLRVHDIDFAGGIIRVVDGKGGKHRVCPLPKAVINELHQQIQRVKDMHQLDIAEGLGLASFARVWCVSSKAQRESLAGSTFSPHQVPPLIRWMDSASDTTSMTPPYARHYEGPLKKQALPSG